jgi:hypothetical protein
MAEKLAADKFANMAIITVSESALNTLTFKKLETGISLMEKVAWVLSRIEYLISDLSAAMFNGAGDSLSFGLSLSNAWSYPYLYETTILDWNKFVRQDLGAAASGLFIEQPFVKDFSSLPGGGILVPPNPLYGYAVGAGLTGPETVTMRMHYTLLPLATDQYWELVEARRVVSS